VRKNVYFWASDLLCISLNFDVMCVSCDFVIHFGHAYTMYSGNVNRQHRSHFALTHMGPSILAAAFTTFMAAVVMVSMGILIVNCAMVCFFSSYKLFNTSQTWQHIKDLHRDHIFPKVCCHLVYDNSTLHNWLLHCILGIVRLLWTRRTY